MFTHYYILYTHNVSHIYIYSIFYIYTYNINIYSKTLVFDNTEFTPH